MRHTPIRFLKTAWMLLVALCLSGAPAMAQTPIESTPTTFLMAAQINGSNTFSECSLAHIRPSLSASCIARPQVVDASIENMPAEVEGTAGIPVSVPIEVSAVGSAPMNDVQLFISLQAPVTVASANVPGGSCAAGGGGLTCELGTIEAAGSASM